MHRKREMRLRLPPAKTDATGATHLKGGGKKHGWKRFLHKPLGSRESGPRTVIRKVGKVIQKEVLPVALAVAGNMMGGPIGGTVGGALGGSLRSSHNIGRNMLKGGMKGLAISGGMHLAQNLASMGGGLSSLKNLIPGFGGSPTGINAGDALMEHGGRQGTFDELQQLGAKHAKSKGKGLGGLFSSLGGLGMSPIDALLGATTLVGTLGGREKVDKGEQEKYNQQINPRNPYDVVPMPTYTPYMRRPNPDYFAGVGTYGGQLPSGNAFIGEGIPQQRAHGGYVHGGYIHGESGGQDDDFETHIPAGSYVMDATTVSALGDGNSRSGRKKIQELRDMFLESGIVPNEQWNPRHAVHVKLSPGEDVLEPELVMAIGKGNEKKGVKKLDGMRKQLRTEKGMKKFLPPKTKSLESYLR